MARPFRQRSVSSINRAYSHDPLEKVESISGINADRTRWTLSQSAAIAAIEAGTDSFFIPLESGPVKLVVLRHREQKYLQSEREAVHPGELLSLLG